VEAERARPDRRHASADFRSAASIKHLFAANQVFSNESQAIPTIQVLSEKTLFRGGRELWVIWKPTSTTLRIDG
jgi:hypothetical protein